MIHTSIEIAAPSEKVRIILFDFPAIPNWHTGFITSINAKNPSKPLEKNDTIGACMGGVNFTATILEPTATSLSWSGPPLYGLFRGIFQFVASSITEGGTSFVQEESFVGIMAWAFSPFLPMGWVTRKHFEKFNAELKVEAEKEE